MCRLRPFTFLAASQPRLALGTVSAARTDWESMTAAVGSASRPAAADLGAQLIVQPGQGAVIAPAGEVPVHGRPGREVAGSYRQAHPVRSRYKIASTIRRSGQTGGRPAARAPIGQVRLDDLPLRIGQVTGIAPGCCGVPARRVPWARAGPLCS